MRPVSTDNLGGIASLVAEHDLDAAVCALDDVVVGEHVAGAVEDEARALALLRHRSIKEVEDQRSGSDVDHGGQHLLVDGDIVLLFCVVGRRGFSLGQLERRSATARIEEREAAQPRGKMRSEVPESTHQQNDHEKPAQFHGY